jgi:AraC-like DNA-binding protein
VTTPPVYRTGHKLYGIDNCEPQKEAVRQGKIEFHALSKGHYPGTLMPEDVLPGLNSIGFWDAKTSQDWGLDTHRNEGIKIVFFETGDCDVLMGHKTFNLHAGDFLITRPWQLHKFGNPNIGRGRIHWVILDVGVRRPNQAWIWPQWVVITPKDLAILTERWQHVDNPLWTSTPALAQSFRELARCITAWDRPHTVSRMAGHLNLLLISVLDALVEQRPRENRHAAARPPAVAEFFQDLRNGRINLGECWTLDRLAAHCHMGVTAFSKYCRELVNSGPMEYLNQCRIECAARQLRAQPALSITEVAFANGFNSSQYFATRFRRHFKISPSQFAAQHNSSPVKKQITLKNAF